MLARVRAGETNEVEGLKWLRASAELGLPESQGLLGSVYREGLYGTDKNPVEGFKWFLRSAEQGNPQSQHLTALCYLNGWGVEPIMKQIQSSRGRTFTGSGQHVRHADQGGAPREGSRPLGPFYGDGRAAGPCDCAGRLGPVLLSGITGRRIWPRPTSGLPWPKTAAKRQKPSSTRAWIWSRRSFSSR